MDITCKFCCKPLKQTDSIDVDHTFRVQLISMLDYLNLNSATLHAENSTCHGCIEKIISSYAFKKNCAQLEKDLPVLNSRSAKVDLRKLLQDKGKLKQNVEDEIQICRLCWSILDCDSVLPLTELLEKENMRTVFREHVPEINLQAVKNPVICGICTNNLDNLKDLLFLSDHFEIVREEYTEDGNGKERILFGEIVKESDSDMDMKPHIRTEKGHDVFDETEEFEAKVKIEATEIKPQPRLIVEAVQLKHEEIDIKSEEIEVDRATDDGNRWRREELQLHERANNPKRADSHELRETTNSKVDLYKCRECSYVGKFAKYLKRHMLVHKDRTEADLFRCRECSYATMRPANLKSHMLIHKAVWEVDSYKCQKCSYAGKHLEYLKRHMLVHRAKSDVDLYKCHKCSYTTKRIGYLKEHMLVHKAKSEVALYKCRECSYAAKRVVNLKRHMSIHLDRSEIDLFKCHECSYAAKLDRDLKRHMLVHKDKSEVDLYKCQQCSFATKQAGNLKRHMLVHKAQSEVDLYKCQKCSYTTKRAANLKRHMLIHAAKSGVDSYKCQECDFATTYATSLKRHILVHKTTPKSKVDLYS